MYIFVFLECCVIRSKERYLIILLFHFHNVNEVKIVVGETHKPFHCRLSLSRWLVHWFSEHCKITYNQFVIGVGHLFLLVIFLYHFNIL